MKVIQQLIAYLEGRGRLTAGQIEQLVSKGYWGHYTGADLRSLAHKVGQSFFFQVTGATTGPLWGTDIYTSDSALAAVCVHVGLLRPGETGVVKVTMVPPVPVFAAS